MSVINGENPHRSVRWTFRASTALVVVAVLILLIPARNAGLNRDAAAHRRWGESFPVTVSKLYPHEAGSSIEMRWADVTLSRRQGGLNAQVPASTLVGDSFRAWQDADGNVFIEHSYVWSESTKSWDQQGTPWPNWFGSMRYYFLVVAILLVGAYLLSPYHRKKVVEWQKQEQQRRKEQATAAAQSAEDGSPDLVKAARAAGMPDDTST